MRNKKRFGALALALVVALSALSGCGTKSPDTSGTASSVPDASASGNGDQAEIMDLTEVTDPYLSVSGLAGDTPVAQLGEEKITASELLYWLERNARTYLNQFGGYLTEIPWDTEVGGSTLGDQLMEGALEAAVYYRTLSLMARAESLSPDEAIAVSVEQEAEDMISQLGSRERVTYVLWAQMLTQDLLIYLNQCSDLNNQLRELYFGENSGSYPTDAEVNAWLDQEGTFRVKHILLMTVNQATQQPLDEETVAQKKSLAEDLLAQLRAAEDPIALFDQLMNEYSEDGGLATNPEGYVFDAGDSLVGGFREATLALSVGQISDVVETDYGYHIMLRLPLDPNKYRASVMSQRLQERIEQYQRELGLEKLPDFDRIDPAVFWTKLTSLQNAVYAELDEGRNASGSQS